MRQRNRRTALLLGATIGALAMVGGAGVTAANAVTTEAPLAVRQVTTGVGIPWGIAFEPGGSALVAERDTHRVLRITQSGAKTTLGTIPGGVAVGEGGLLGLAVSRSYATDHFLYAFQSTGSGNRVVRVTVSGSSISAPTVLLTGIARSTFHNSGRLRFGPDGFLYVSTGDAQNTANAQNRDSLNGKILRITTTGAAAPGNPFGNRVYSMGHRNVEGLAFDSSGRLWASELGPSTVDELNLIRPGGNYGWGGCSTGGCIAPVRTWSVASASPSGIAIIGDHLYMATLRGQRLYRLTISGSTVGGQVTMFNGTYGRLRTVEPSPVGGGFWLTTTNRDDNGTPRPGDDRILHVTGV
jgi:glucose/arabinose dehydrogenase